MTFVARLLLGVAAVRWALTGLKYLFLSLISNVCNDIGYWLFEVVKKKQTTATTPVTVCSNHQTLFNCCGGVGPVGQFDHVTFSHTASTCCCCTYELHNRATVSFLYSSLIFQTFFFSFFSLTSNVRQIVIAPRLSEIFLTLFLSRF